MRQGTPRPAARLPLTCCLAVLVGAEVAAQGEGLFSAADTGAAPTARARAGEAGMSWPRTIRSRPVRIDLAMLDVARAAADGARSPATLTLNLFEDAAFQARVEHSTPTRSGYALTGRLEGVPFGTMTLVVNGRVVAGTVRTQEATWRIRSAGAGLYLIREVDLSTLPPGAEPLEPAPDPPVPPSASGNADPEAAADDGSVIDVLVLHTPAASEAEGGTARIEALVDLWVAETNQAYADSGVIHRIELVGQSEVAYVESGDARNHVLRLQNPYDGSMDHIHDMRDAYAADIVSLVYRRQEEDGRICGAGVLNYALESDSNAPLWAFSASGVSCGTLSFAHELGHVMGLRHDRYVEGGEQRPYPFSAGYVNQRAFEDGAPESSRWYTIMAYDDQCADAGFYCRPLLRFSNPDQTYLDDPLGAPGDAPTDGVDGPADARRSLNITRSVVAGYRSSRDREACKPILRPERQFVTAGGGNFEVAVIIHHECDWTATTEAEFVLLTGADGTGSGILTFEVAANVGRARAGRVTISGHSFLVEQVGPVNEGICDRTLVVHREIVRVAGVDHCWNVTSAHLSTVRELLFLGRRITELRAGDFSGLSSLQRLSLLSNDLTSLPEGLFAGLSSLRYLSFWENRLTALPGDIFAGLTRLETLQLGYNNLGSLPPELFAGLSSLRDLGLNDNPPLTTLPPNLFAGLTSLRRLSFTDSKLRALPEGIFAGLSSLEDLSLADNALTALPEDAFAGSSRLRMLGLGGNDFTTLPPGLFRGLSDLERLFLFLNDLTSLPEGIFSGLGNLERLWLGSNALTELPEGIFRGLPNLRHLMLGRNALGSLPERVFAGLSRLSFLELADNELTALPPKIFADLSALELVWLSRNQLNALPAGVFSGLSNLRNLELEGNPGAPFTLTLQLVRTDHTTFGGAVAVEVTEGAPFEMAVPLSATGATLSANASVVGAGGRVGAGVAVTRRARTATVQPGPPAAIPRGSGCGRTRCFNGLRLATEGLVEFSARAPFTDDPLHPGVTRVKAIHFLELRERIDLLREDAGLPRFRWTDPVLTGGVTPVRRVHVAELREALAEVYAATGRPARVYSDGALPAGTVVRAAHVMELRTAVRALE